MKRKRQLELSHEPPPIPRVTPLRKMHHAHSIEAVIASERIWGFTTHWEGARTLPHFEDKRECPGCARQLPKRWKGFLLLWDPLSRMKFWFEITPFAAESLKRQTDSFPLRQAMIRVRRERPQPKAPMWVEVWMPERKHADLPPDESPIPTLEVLWGIRGELS